MTRPLSITIGALRWTIHPDWRDRLLGPHGLRLDEWLRDGRAQVVKQGPHRTVYRVQLGGPEALATGACDIYLKQNRPWNLRAWLREIIRPPKSRIEYNQARDIAARGIDTVEPLAVGEPVGLAPADSFLITRGLANVRPLDQFLEATLPTLAAERQGALRRTLARELAAFLRRLHDQGVTHHDLHPGNLLLRLEAGDQPRLFLVDLHATSVGPPLDAAARAANLTMLNIWFASKSQRTDRLRFWKHYGSTDKQAAADLEKRTLQAQFHLWNSRHHRCLGSNRYFQRLKRSGWTGHAVRDLDTGLLEQLASDPAAAFAWPGATLIKDSPSSTVAELEWLGRQLIWKRFRVGSWQDPWLAMLRRTPALRSWIQGHALLQRGLPTARPLLLLQRQAEGYLLTEKVTQAENLHHHLWGLEKRPQLEQQQRRRQLIDGLARLLRDLHQRGLAHRDLKANNILVRSQELGVRSQGPQVWLIDLVGVTRHRTVGRARRVQNLARLNASLEQHRPVTRTDRLRFLMHYLMTGLKGRAGWKRWWRDIEAATQAKLERNRRRGRVVG